MLNIKQVRDLIIMPVLRTLDLPSDRPTNGVAACELLMGTAMQESRFEALHQYGGGPALGLWQMEPATATYNWTWLNTKADIKASVMKFVTGQNWNDQLVGNLYLACALARIDYYRQPAPLPAAGDLPAQAAYYKQYYNTPAGAATIEEYITYWGIMQNAMAHQV